jgi:hypothetical protein
LRAKAFYLPEIPFAFWAMVKTVVPTSVSPDVSVMLDAVRTSWPPLVARYREGLLLAERRLAAMEKRPQSSQQSGAAATPK